MDFPLNPDYPYYVAEEDFTDLGSEFANDRGIDWSRFLLFGEERVVAPGEYLIRQFECDPHIFVLTHGELEVRLASSPDGPQQPIATIQPIAVIGEQSFVDDGPRTASVVARSRSTVYRLTREAFAEMQTSEPRVAWAFLMDIARSLSRRARTLLARQSGL